MAERSRFFNSTAGDVREYTASEFAEYFSKFLSNGVYVENGETGLKVSAGTGLSVNIATGYAFLEGYLYVNDTEFTKEIEPADNVLNRIDRVVVRLSVVNRDISIHIKTGVFSSSPNPPSLVNTGDVVELSLAQVKVSANASTVQVIDERLTEHCGLVELLAEVPLNELMEQWNTWFANRQQELSKYSNTTGTGGNYIANINGITELLEGLKITVKFHEGRTGESFINLNDFGNTPITKPGGGNPNIKANGVYSLVFDGLNFQLQGEGGEYGTATQGEVLEGYTVGTEEGLIEGILKLTGTALSNQVLSGRTFYNIDAKTKITGTMPNRGAPAQVLTSQGGQYNIPEGYFSGGSVKAQFANLSAGNIRNGVNIGGVVGNVKALGTIKLLHEVFGMKYPFDFPITRSYTGNFIGLVVYTNPSIPEEVGYTKSFVRTILGTYEYNTGGEYNDILRTVITTDSLTISANASMWIGYTLFYTE